MSRISTSVTAIGVPDREFTEAVDAPAAAPTKKSSKSDAAATPVAETEETP